MHFQSRFNGMDSSRFTEVLRGRSTNNEASIDLWAGMQADKTRSESIPTPDVYLPKASLIFTLQSVPVETLLAKVVARG